MLRQIELVDAGHQTFALPETWRIVEDTGQIAEVCWNLKHGETVVAMSTASRCLPNNHRSRMTYGRPTLGEGDHLFGCAFYADPMVSFEELRAFHQYTRDAYARQCGFRSVIVEIRLDARPDHFSVAAWSQQATYGAVDDPFVDYLCERRYFELGEHEGASVWRWFDQR